ncbi:MAG TPA: hypothetical protein VGG72_03495 [Bryobacteraceae bacterium]|jgi:hypothetical protein
MKALVDNDIIFKGACYGLLDAFLAPISVADDSFGVLGAARFVVSKKIIRKAPHKGIAAAHEHLATFLGRAAIVEPTEDEQRMAAEFELAAQRAGLGFDAGESQLCSILICRSTPLLLTGDKKAIQAIEQLLDSESRLVALCGKIRCLEQLVLEIFSASPNPDALRTAICAEVEVDKTLTICFSCHREDGSGLDYAEGLKSYLTDLQRRATRVLGTFI